MVFGFLLGSPMDCRYRGPMTDLPYAPSGIRALPSWLLGRAAARGHRLVAEALASEGLRMMHHAVLSAVAELGPVSQAELGRTLGIDPKDMVAIVNDLQKEGLVTRTPDPEDRRKNAIGISDDGRRRLRRTQASRRRGQRRTHRGPDSRPSASN